MPVLKSTAKRLDPARTLVIGFLIIIAVGTFLLCLPVSSRSGQYTPLVDCLFTATSATCVTGLVIYDTYSHWSVFGQFIIALMIQIGGLGFVTIITFFNVAAGKQLGFRTLKNAAGDLTENSFSGGKRILVMIMKYSLLIELVGAVILGFVYVPKYGAYGIWMSVFMSISAFCNSGFDLMGIEEPYSSLIHCNSNAVVLLTIALMIIIGSLGFIVWENISNLKSTRKLSMHTRAVLLMTAILIVGGTLFYLAFEWKNEATIGAMGFGDKLLNAFFSSVSNRTAGFNSISTSDLTEFSQLGTMFLMFVGAAPGSTGGGIKVTTLLVLIMTVISYLRSKEDVEIFRHKIGKATVYRTMVTSVLSMCAIAVCFAALYLSLPDTAEQTGMGAFECLFDAISTFSTAGLSVGAVAAVHGVGRALTIVMMFMGRVGPVSLLLSLSLNNGTQRKNLIMPEGQIIIG